MVTVSPTVTVGLSIEPGCSTTFNNGYAEWAASQCLTMHIDRRSGQKMEVDWAGAKLAT